MINRCYIFAKTHHTFFELSFIQYTYVGVLEHSFLFFVLGDVERLSLDFSLVKGDKYQLRCMSIVVLEHSSDLKVHTIQFPVSISSP